MTRIPDFPVRDLKLEAIARLALENWDYPSVRTPKLEPVLANFRSNCSRVRFLMSLPTSIAGAATITQRVHDLAELEITGSLLRTGHLSQHDEEKIELLRTEMLENEKQSLEALQGTAEGDASALKYHLDYAKALSGFAEGPLGAYGLIPWFSAQVTGTWTAIETMLGDLWEHSLNIHPRTLAALKGSPPNRIALLAGGGKPSKERREYGEKEVPLSQIEWAKFDIKHKMGTIFRRQRRFEFTRLSDIREAYSRAFEKKAGRIDKALSSRSLDCLSVVRNAIVHNGGHADNQYVEQSHLDIPKANRGEPIRLDGDNVAKLIKSAIASSKDLMIGVDDWLQGN
jgi:hypothetical protein